MPKEEKVIKLCEIARSYSRKINTGNYTSVDLFCSQKLEVPEDEAEEASKRAIQFCQNIVDAEAEVIIEAHKPESEKIIQQGIEI
jgi:hypothetical protein